jgi:tetratricopeptide (TPR) repeat protein
MIITIDLIRFACRLAFVVTLIPCFDISNISTASNILAYNSTASTDSMTSVYFSSKVIIANIDDAENYYNKGVENINLKSYQKAIIDFDRAIASSSRVARYYSARAQAKALSKQYQAAITDYSKAISIEPYMVDGYVGRGKVKAVLGQYREAIVDLDKAIYLGKLYEEPTAYFYRAAAKDELGNKQEAISDYSKAIALNPKYTLAYGRRGLAKLSLGDKRGAIVDTEKTVELARQQNQTDLYGKSMNILKSLR